MKTIINESKYNLDITLEPETKEELLQLLRYASNTKKRKKRRSRNFTRKI